jgi:hypothetical protein
MLRRCSRAAKRRRGPAAGLRLGEGVLVEVATWRAGAEGGGAAWRQRREQPAGVDGGDQDRSCAVFSISFESCGNVGRETMASCFLAELHEYNFSCFRGKREREEALMSCA